MGETRDRRYGFPHGATPASRLESPRRAVEACGHSGTRNEGQLMTDHEGGTGHGPVASNAETSSTDRRSAHERLSTGAWARWTRACASHPWRVVGSWVGIIVVLIALFHGPPLVSASLR